jgi:hypothetical protein
MRPHVGIVVRAAWRKSGSARWQPQETVGPSTSLLPRQPHRRTPPARGRTAAANGAVRNPVSYI